MVGAGGFAIALLGSPSAETSDLPDTKGRRDALRQLFLAGLCFTKEMVGAGGFEPLTSWSQTKRSSQLSYAPILTTSMRYNPI